MKEYLEMEFMCTLEENREENKDEHEEEKLISSSSGALKSENWLLNLN